MNASKNWATTGPSDTAEDSGLDKARSSLVETIQHLGQTDLLAAQSLAGHGKQWGHWQNPKTLVPSTLPRALRDIDFARRLRDRLTEEYPPSVPVDHLLQDGVLALTRLAILIRLVPSAGNGHGKALYLKPSSLAQALYQPWPRIVARALRRKTEAPGNAGLFCCLTPADLVEFRAKRLTRVELQRLDILVGRGVWSDSPPLPDIRQTTDPSQTKAVPPPKEKPDPYLPFPDEWLAEIGPRILWVVQALGPNLLRLLEALPKEAKDIDWNMSSASISAHLQRRIGEQLMNYPWLDGAGAPLAPPFPLKTSSAMNSAPYEWPPRTWDHVITLSLTLQAAHLFIALLTSAGRIGEIATLTRDCVELGRDGKEYLSGHTYKLSQSLFGDNRKWPAPEILSRAIGQQARLASAWDWLPSSLVSGLPLTPRFGGALWVSLGKVGPTGEENELKFNDTLMSLARRLNVDATPGGKNVHAHRFRKTIGRLAGIALWNSPLVLKRLFGHKSIEMTLHYILCDPYVREEAERVLRELRIMHCAEALDEIHQALRNGAPLPEHGGPGAARLITAVRNEEEHLKQGGREWSERSAYDLSCLLTMQGQGWRLIKENIICSKAPGEDGLCQSRRFRGEPNTANCQPQCENRIVFARKRRDAELIVDQYLDLARRARDEGQLLVVASVMHNAQDEWVDFPDLAAKYHADSEVQSLLALCKESEPVSEAA